MKLAPQPYRVRWKHWMEGGTGLTNFSPAWAEKFAPIYLQAAANTGTNGITVINRDMDGNPGWSLHNCAHASLAAFWAEVDRLKAVAA